MRVPPSRHKHLPKAPLPNIIKWKLGFNIWMDTNIWSILLILHIYIYSIYSICIVLNPGHMADIVSVRCWLCQVTPFPIFLVLKWGVCYTSLVVSIYINLYLINLQLFCTGDLSILPYFSMDSWILFYIWITIQYYLFTQIILVWAIGSSCSWLLCPFFKCHHSLSTSLLSSIIRCFRFTLYIYFLPQPGISPGSFMGEWYSKPRNRH